MFDFEKLKQLNDMLSDEQGRKLLDHPKLRALLADEGFKKAVQERIIFKIISNPAFQRLTQDPEFRQLMVEFKKRTDSSSAGDC